MSPLPTNVKPSGHHRRNTVAMTLIEVLVVMAVLFILIGMIIPATTRPRTKATRIRCVNNLKQVGLAFRIWSGEHGDKFPMSASITNGGTMEFASGRNIFMHFLVISKELGTPEILVCPADKEREAATNFDSNFNSAGISYFVGLDADETKPLMLLAGDRNLATSGVPLRPGLANITTNDLLSWTTEIHNKSGNVLFGDGSVQQLTTKALQKALHDTGSATNRLVIP